MWSAGIEPLIPYAIRGVVWYQGESNAETRARVRQHGRLFPLLINQWRKRWGQGDFPFLYVQLPALNRPEWPWFREGQRRVLSELENVGMAITFNNVGLPASPFSTESEETLFPVRCIVVRPGVWPSHDPHHVSIRLINGPLSSASLQSASSTVPSS
jgi:hypothetical protein